MTVTGTCANPSSGDVAVWLPTRRADHRIAYEAGPLQFGDLWLPASDPGERGHPVVVSVHGGGWQSDWSHDYMAPASERLSDRGIAVWEIEFRRIGNRGGGFPGTYLDLVAALSRLAHIADEHRLDLDRVVAIGHSSGAHLAAWLATRRNLPAGSPVGGPDPVDLRGVVELAPLPDLEQLGFFDGVFVHLREVLLGLAGAETEQELAARLPQISPRHMGTTPVPRVMVIGDQDTIPVAYVTEQAQIASGDGASVRTIVVEGANHFDLVDPAGGAWPPVESAIHQLLA